MGGIGGDLITAWIESADSADHANLHFYAYSIRVLSSFLEKEGVGLDLATADDLRRFERKMHREHRGTTARSIVGAAKRFYNWASDQGVCRDVAKDALSKGGWVSYTRAPLEPADALRIIDAAKSPRDRAMLSLAMRCDLKPRDIVSARPEGLVLEGDGGEIMLANGSWSPITKACSNDLREHLAQQGHGLMPGRLFTAEKRSNVGVCLKERTLRGIFSDAFRHAGMPLPAGEYATGSACVELAVEEGEPIGVIIALCDRTHHYRKRREDNRG